MKKSLQISVFEPEKSCEQDRQISGFYVFFYIQVVNVQTYSMQNKTVKSKFSECVK